MAQEENNLIGWGPTTLPEIFLIKRASHCLITFIENIFGSFLNFEFFLDFNVLKFFWILIFFFFFDFEFFFCFFFLFLWGGHYKTLYLIVFLFQSCIVADADCCATMLLGFGIWKWRDVYLCNTFWRTRCSRKGPAEKGNLMSLSAMKTGSLREIAW